jgi:hypothetical protein
LPKLNIPERYRPILSSVRSLSERDTQQIRTVLDQVASSQPRNSGAELELPSDPGAAMVAVRNASARVEIANFTKILDLLVTLYEIKSQRDVAVEEFVDSVCDAMESLDNPEYRLAPSERADFAGKLLTLLNAEIFALVTKAQDLVTEDERTFCHARILTDLRPIFGSNVEDGPKAMITMHTLKLAFHQQGSSADHGEFYVAMDAEDLQALRKLIDRAEAKAKSLHSALGKNVKLFGIPPQKE